MFGQSVKNILVAGHRGIKTLYPENTMVSFKAAHDAGVDMIEMDLRLTKDGKLVVIHDTTLDRTTDGTGVVSDFTLSELKKLDAGCKFDARFAGEKMITFDEFLEFVKTTDLLLNVELKSYARDCADKAVKALTDAGLNGRYVIASFSAELTTYAHAKYGVPTQGFPVKYMANPDADTNKHLYSVGVAVDWLNDPECKKEVFDALGIDYWTWCPDTEPDVLRCIEAGTTLMTCNDPFPALKVLREKNLHK